MDGWIIYNENKKYGVNAFQWMVDEGRNHGLNIEVKFFQRFKIIAGENLNILYDDAFVKLPKFAILRGYDIDLAMALEAKGIRVVNSSRSMELSRDKWKSHLVLGSKGIKSPKSIKVHRDEFEYHKISEFLGETFVTKIISGAKGYGVCLVDSEDKIYDIKEEFEDEFFICQKYIKESSGKDLRVHVIGGKVVAVIKRSSKSDFRANYFLGGEAEWVEIGEETEKLAVDAAEALGLEIAGVDILEGNDGDYVCEVNGNAGFFTVWKYSEISIPEEIMKYVSNNMNDIRSLDLV